MLSSIIVTVCRLFCGGGIPIGGISIQFFVEIPANIFQLGRIYLMYLLFVVRSTASTTKQETRRYIFS
jgi:hypothetical protein